MIGVSTFAAYCIALVPHIQNRFGRIVDPDSQRTSGSAQQ
jgi:hypothetical protein